ncbi:hypothetical protein HJFPF1_09339 [Paramyrothecium foliicola]|nr:hypothetical protein HJFPF1_09339 [Paramyrothecium foliicola]
MASQKASRDWIYLAIVSLQTVGMLVLDFVQFYPKALWATPGAPLHFLVPFRSWYVAFSEDPFFAAEHHAPWFEASVYVELLIQFPCAAYLIYNLASGKPSSGVTELAGLVYAVATSVCSGMCLSEVWSMGPEVVSAEKRTSLLFGTYGPYCVIPALMAVDMYLRLLPRVQAGTSKAKAQ